MMVSYIVIVAILTHLQSANNILLTSSFLMLSKNSIDIFLMGGGNYNQRKSGLNEGGERGIYLCYSYY